MPYAIEYLQPLIEKQGVTYPIFISKYNLLLW
jgi:hypothetical protein